MKVTEQFANFAQSTLSGGITQQQTFLYVNEPRKFPLLGTFRLVLQQFDPGDFTPLSVPEIVIVTSVAGSRFNVTRGAEGTTALAFPGGTVVQCIVTAGVMTSLAGGSSAVMNISGAAGTLSLTAIKTTLFVDTSGGVASFALPVAGTQGREVKMIDYKGTSGSNPITTTFAGGGTLNGSSSPFVTNTAYAIITFIDNGTSWNQ